MCSGRLLVMFFAAAVAQNDVRVDCGGESVAVRWRLDAPRQLDVSRALLGTCAASSTEAGHTLLFSVSLRDCGFQQQVSPDRVTFSNLLTYDQRPAPTLSRSVQCVYDLAVSSRTEEEEEDEGAVSFSLELMNGDFSAPAPSLRFRLGSALPVRAAVESGSRGPLWIYMDSCMASTDADISRAARVHPVITNSGSVRLWSVLSKNKAAKDWGQYVSAWNEKQCFLKDNRVQEHLQVKYRVFWDTVSSLDRRWCLMESKWGNSSFLPRRGPAEIRLYLQAFKFAVGQKVFLLCDLEAWDVQRMDHRLCHYLQQQHRWELLDDPSQSYVCSSCESSSLRTTDAASGVFARRVLGPFVMEEDSLDTQSSTDRGLSDAPVWLMLVCVAVALGTVVGVVAVSYYLCFWRGGRLGYRPSRDLLTKY